MNGLIQSLTIRVCLVAVVKALFTLGHFGQGKSESFLGKSTDLEIRIGNIFQICGGIAVSEHVPVGIEGAVDFDMGSVKNIRIDDGRLEDVLNSIIQQDPRYKWEMRDGAINFYPVLSRRKQFLKDRT